MPEEPETRPRARLTDLDKPAELGDAIVKDGVEYPLLTRADILADPRKRFQVNALLRRVSEIEQGDPTEDEAIEAERLTVELVGYLLPTMASETVKALTPAMRGRAVLAWSESMGPDPLARALEEGESSSPGSS